MENFNIPEQPEFTEELRRLQTTDEAHADVFNALFEKLIQNDVFLNNIVDKLVSKSNIIHDTEIEEAEKIPGADVTANLQRQIKEVYKNLGIWNISPLAKYKLAQPLDDTLEFVTLASGTNMPAGDSFYYVFTLFFGEVALTANRKQLAFGYRTNKIASRYHFEGEWSSWTYH